VGAAAWLRAVVARARVENAPKPRSLINCRRFAIMASEKDSSP